MHPCRSVPELQRILQDPPHASCYADDTRFLLNIKTSVPGEPSVLLLTSVAAEWAETAPESSEGENW